MMIENTLENAMWRKQRECPFLIKQKSYKVTLLFFFPDVYNYSCNPKIDHIV